MFRKFAVRLLIAIPVVTLSWTSVTAVELRTVPLLNLHESTPFPLPSEIALTYVSETKRIPEGELQVAGEESFVFPTLRRTFTNISVVHSTTEILRTYYVLIDSETGTITEDLDGLRQAEAEAYHAKYGKLQPSLYDALQTATITDTFSVMFVITPDASGRTEEDRFALLAEEFPEASEAIERGASPWEVENSEISVKILARYDEMRAEDGKMVVVPLIEAIADLGFESTIGWDSVRVVSILTKDAILKIVTRPEVIHAEEMGGLEQPTDNSAIRIFLPTMIR